jgi:iron complex outermembrane receptor protein
VGASKNTLNLVGYYDDTRLSARLAYTYRSHFLVGLDRSAAQNQDNYGTLDGSISFKINDHFSLTFDALNITDELLKYYALNKSQPRATYENGRQFFFGVRVRY